MIKWIFIGIMILIGLLDYALVVACSRMENRETYEEFQEWKARRDNEAD